MCERCGVRGASHRTPTTIAGVDGCGPKWLAIAQEPGRRQYAAVVLNTEELAAQTWDLIAIDIPIGLPESGAREADVAARKFIQPRGSSVFPSPIRPALSAQTWREGCDITYAHDGKGISQQTFAILPKIRDVDQYVRSTTLRDRLFEVHPEVSFAAWNKAPMAYPKRDQQGHQDRRALIARYFGEDAFDSVRSQVRGEKVAADDITDAFAALWTANRLLIGAAARLPADPQFDSLGLPMHIWY
jgi:predicted RNase H-like nuclease